MSESDEKVRERPRKRNRPAARTKESKKTVEMFEAIEHGALQERREREVFRSEILEALASFRREVPRKTEDGSKLSSSTITRNPLLLLILGFALTGILGAWITLVFQSREWNRQQSMQSSEWNKQQIRLVQIHEVDQKYGMIDEVTKAVVEHDSAAMDALASLTWTRGDPRIVSEGPERLKHWQQASKDWRVTSQKLLQKLIIHFKDPRVQLIFQAAVEKRSRIDNDFTTLQGEYGRGRSTSEDAEFMNRVYSANDSINKATGDLRRLVEIMVIDIEPDLRAPMPE